MRLISMISMWAVLTDCTNLRNTPRVTCYHNNPIHQALYEVKPTKFIELSPFDCKEMTTLDRCALTSSFRQECAWCVSQTNPTVRKCVNMDAIDFEEQRGFMCAPHATRAQLATGQPGVRFGWKSKQPQTNLIPPRHKPWGTWEFCNAMESLFGGQPSKFDFEKYDDVKTRLSNVNFMDEAKGAKLNAGQLQKMLTSVWTAQYPADMFVMKCKEVMGEVCRLECISLARIFEHASRPGVEAYAGRADKFTNDWEMSEADYRKSMMGHSDYLDGQMEGGDWTNHKDLLGRNYVPGIRKVDIPRLKENRVLHYRLSAKGCIRCLDHDVCTPDCLLGGTSPCD